MLHMIMGFGRVGDLPRLSFAASHTKLCVDRQEGARYNFGEFPLFFLS